MPEVASCISCGNPVFAHPGMENLCECIRKEKAFMETEDNYVVNEESMEVEDATTK